VEFANTYLATGRLILVEGSIRNRRYTDAQGIERSVTEIIAFRLTALDTRPAQSLSPSSDEVSMNAHEVATEQHFFQ